MSRPDPTATPNLLVTALRHLSNLLQSEVQLAKLEMKNNISRAILGLVFFGIAALLCLTALNVFAAAAVAYLATLDMSAGTASLIVGGVCLAIAGGLALAGRSRLSSDALSPDHTMRNLERDATTIKGATYDPAE